MSLAPALSTESVSETTNNKTLIIIFFFQKLQILNLSGTLLESLPYELSELKKLVTLKLYNTQQLTFPPIYIIKKGKQAILEFLAKSWIDHKVKQKEEYFKEQETSQSYLIDPNFLNDTSIPTFEPRVFNILVTVSTSPNEQYKCTFTACSMPQFYYQIQVCLRKPISQTNTKICVWDQLTNRYFYPTDFQQIPAITAVVVEPFMVSQVYNNSLI